MGAPDRGDLRHRCQRCAQRDCRGQGCLWQEGQHYHHQRQGPSLQGRHRPHGARGRAICRGGQEGQGAYRCQEPARVVLLPDEEHHRRGQVRAPSTSPSSRPCRIRSTRLCSGSRLPSMPRPRSSSRCRRTSSLWPTPSWPRCTSRLVVPPTPVACPVVACPVATPPLVAPPSRRSTNCADQFIWGCAMGKDGSIISLKSSQLCSTVAC